MFRNRLYKYAYPSYECENCIGMIEHGCFCDKLGSIAPGGVEPNILQKIIRFYLERTNKYGNFN